MQHLRANTAVDVLIGPFMDEDDGKTTEEALTIEDEHVLLSKLGQGLAAKNDANDAVHDANGYHNCPLNTTDTASEGTLVLTCHMTGALPVRHEYMVLSEAAWDSLYVAKDDGFMDVNIKTVGRADTQETEANNLESAAAAWSATRGLAGTALPAAAADAAGGLMISDDGGFDADELYDAIVTDAAGANIAIDIIAIKAETALIVADTGELQVDDYPTSIAAIQTTVDAIEVGTITNATGADVATDVVALKAETVLILADTDDIGVAGAGLTDLGGMSAGMKAEVNVECDGAFATYDPPTKAEMDTAHALLATPANVNTQVVDVMKTDVVTLPGDEAPPVTPTMEEAIAWLYKFLRNKTESTATRIHVYDDAGTNKDHSSIISDDATTFTRGEFGVGDA